MVDVSRIKNGMPIIGSDGEPIGAVDGVEGDRIKLTRKDSLDNQHHYIPLAWVSNADERVHLNKGRADILASWGGTHAGGVAAGAGAARGSSTVTETHDKKTNWLAWIALALGLLALLWWLSRRGDDPQTTTTTTETAVVDPGLVEGTAAGVAGATAPVGETAAGLEPTGNVLADMQAYLGSAEAAGRRFTFDNINFATNSAELPADASTTVAGLAQALAAAPAARIRIEGYTDARGGAAANAQLGAQRAESVAQALIAAGVDAGRVETATGGEMNPIETNATSTGQTENRRTDIVVVSK